MIVGQQLHELALAQLAKLHDATFNMNNDRRCVLSLYSPHCEYIIP